MSDVRLDPLAPDVAIRHPKRGKAHRGVPKRLMGGGLSPRVISRSCDPYLSFHEGVLIPLAQTAPEDRCRRCFPATPEETR